MYLVFIVISFLNPFSGKLINTFIHSHSRGYSGLQGVHGATRGYRRLQKSQRITRGYSGLQGVTGG